MTISRRTTGLGWESVAALVAFTGWYLFALTGPFSTTLADLGLVLVLVASVAVASQVWRDIRFQWVFWLVLVLLVYLALHMAFFMPAYAEQAVRQNPNWTHWFRVGGIWALLLGWWLFRYPKHVGPLFIVLVSGLFLGLLVGADLHSIVDRGVLTRAAWGYQPNYLGLASGSAFLSIFSWVLFRDSGRRSVLLWALVFIVLAALLFLVFVSGSRRAWVLLPVGIISIGFFCVYFGKPAFVLRRLFLGLVLVGLLFGITMVAGYKHIAERLMGESETVAHILSLEWESAADSRGMGARTVMWRVAWEALKAEPWFGWGSGAGARLLKTDDFTEIVSRGHFHSLYLEVLVSFGLVGFVLFGVVFWLILRASWRSAKIGAISLPMAVGLSAVTVFVLLVMVISVRIGQTEGRALLTSLLAFHAYAMFRASAVQNET